MTPQLERLPGDLSEGEQLPEYPTTPEERDAQEVDPPVGVGDPDQGSREPSPSAAQGWLLPLLRVAGFSALALLLLALPLLFLPLAKRLRTDRRRAEPHAELRAIGAWQELVDGIMDGGIGVGIEAVVRRASRQEAAVLLGERLDGVQAGLGAEVRRIAAEVDRAVFSAEGISAAEADALWRDVEGALGLLRSALTRRGRVLSRYSLRSYGIRFAVSSQSREESRRRDVARGNATERQASLRTGRRN